MEPERFSTPLRLLIAVPDAILPRQPFPALPYLLHPCSRPPSDRQATDRDVGS